MKIKFLASGNAPDYYEINGAVVTVFMNGQSDSYDFSGVSVNTGKVEIDTFNDIPVIRKAEYVGTGEDGELYLTLAQKVLDGHWEESDWIDAATYDPTKRYVKFNSNKSFTGIPTYFTKDGVQYLEV